MRYVNAQDVLPKDILALVRQHIDGAYIYIPRNEENRKNWGENTRSKQETKERNAEIYAQYKSGQKVGELAVQYFLSDKSIQRIITQGKKQEGTVF
ncbi:MAG: CD3324 family protein [Defluviitaleaceae bacterium]|nr:CD3324 family protein [Defluviitaleaceae bacterium]